MMNARNGDKVDWIAILVSGERVDKLLAAPGLGTVSGGAQADAVVTPCESGT